MSTENESSGEPMPSHAIMAEIETLIGSIAPGQAVTAQNLTFAISDLIEARIREALADR